jgi:hypothetical protein
MVGEDDIVNTFAICSRLLTRLSLQVKDDFFSGLCEQEATQFLEQFVRFLKLNSRVGKTSSNIVRRDHELYNQIQNIIRLLEIVKYLNLSEPITPLFLERELLKLKNSIIGFYVLTPDLNAKAEKPSRSVISEELKKMGHLHQRIFDLVKSQGQIQNSEIFKTIPGLSRRTLKRKLSELVKLNVIRRVSEGKKVVYSISDIAG